MKLFSSIATFLGYTFATFLVFGGTTFVFAQTGGADLARGFVGKINDAILFPLIMLMMAIAILVFLYGAFEYVAGADNDGVRDKGRQHLLWGTIGLLVMVSAVAILEIAANTFGLGGELDSGLPRR